jgi:HK97 family phage prohead protease
MGTPWLGSQWKEKIDKNALADTILKNTYGLLNHDTNWVLGKAGKNMTLTVDKIGLFVEITLGNSFIDDYVFDRVEKELMDGMSFWFDSKTMIATDWENKIDTIVKINEIYEVSLLPFPAYPQTVMVAQEMTEIQDPNVDDGEQRGAKGEQRDSTEEPEANDEKEKVLALLDLEMEA